MTVPLSSIPIHMIQNLIIGALSAYGLTIIGIIWRTATWKTQMELRLLEVEKRTSEFVTVRAELDVIKNDIKWIRDTMEKQQFLKDRQ